MSRSTLYPGQVAKVRTNQKDGTGREERQTCCLYLDRLWIEDERRAQQESIPGARKEGRPLPAIGAGYSCRWAGGRAGSMDMPREELQGSPREGSRFLHLLRQWHCITQRIAEGSQPEETRAF